MRRKLYLSLGWLAILLGLAGIFLPLLPTTPFLLLAAWCFTRSSPRFLSWLTRNAYLNAYLENYRSRRGVPYRIKVRSYCFLWGTLGLSALLWGNIWYWMLLFTVGIGVSIHLALLPTSHLEPQRFTLIELLISLGIIALLAGILLPALSRARNAARTVACSSNLRQIGTLIEFYTDDNRGLIPSVAAGTYAGYSLPIIKMYGGTTFALGKLVNSYRQSPRLFGCPNHPDRGPEYVESAWNAGGVVQTAYLYRETDCDFNPKKAHPSNAKRALVIDFACISATGIPLIPHGFADVNLLYNDGRVERRRNSPAPGELFTLETTAGALAVPECDTAWYHADSH